MAPYLVRPLVPDDFAALGQLEADIFGALGEAVCEFYGGPCVIVANHTSYLDALVLAQLTPCAAIAKGEVADWPVIGNGGRALGVIYVDRASPVSGARALRLALRALEAGASVLNFPEGTTTDGTRVLPFKRGIFGAARLARVPTCRSRCAGRRPSWRGPAAPPSSRATRAPRRACRCTRASTSAA